MAEFIFKKRIRKRSNKDINSIKSLGQIRLPSYISVFQHEHNGNFFEFNDVEILRHKRNNTITKFFNSYSNKKKYQLFEYGIPFSTTDNIGLVIQKIKRRCQSMNNLLLGYIWVFDVGEKNLGSHYHLIIATKKLLKRRYPNELKITINKKKLHGDFVRNSAKFKNYLIGKDIYEKGFRKRIYGVSKQLKK